MGRVGRSGRIERHKANDRLAPASHQTGQAVFPHPAFRVSFHHSTFSLRFCLAVKHRVEDSSSYGRFYLACASHHPAVSSLLHSGTSARASLPAAYASLRIITTTTDSDSSTDPNGLAFTACAASRGLRPAGRGLPSFSSSTSSRAAHVNPVRVSCPWLFPLGFRLTPSHVSHRLGVSESYAFEAHCGSFALRPGCSPAHALHPASRRRSLSRLAAGNSPPGVRDFHPGVTVLDGARLTRTSISMLGSNIRF